MFWLATLNLILIFLIYTPTLNGYFLAEDYAWWLYVKSKSFFEVLKYFVVPPSQALAGFYHPLIGLSYWLNVNFSWMKPFGFHLTNLLLHLSNYLLVVVLAYFFFKKTWPAILAGFFFVIFPFHSEAVAWIDGRHYLLPTFFYLLSFYLFLRWQENKKGSLLGFSVFTYLLALLAHEVTITLPLALTLCLIYTSEVVGNQHRVLVRLKHTVWYWVVLGGYLMLHGVYVGYFNPFRGASHLSTIVSRILVFYLIFLVFSMMFFFIVRKQKGWDKDHLGLERGFRDC